MLSLWGGSLKFAGLRQGRYKRILAEVEGAVKRWPKLAKRNGVPASVIRAIAGVHEFTLR